MNLNQTTALDIKTLRADTPGVKKVTHFNNAGASLPTRQTLEAIKTYLDKEAMTGGYRLAEESASTLNNVYQEAAKLINAKPDEIALTDSATSAFNQALYALDLQKGDVILTSEIEYGNNYLSFLKLKEKGIETRIASTFEPGLEQFKKQIDGRVKLIAVTHVPTQCGAVAPVEEIGKIAKEHTIVYLLDACQSAGQIPLDVEKIGCDFLSATSRKYIRGPRGLGFLYVNQKMLSKINPPHIEMLFATMQDAHSYELQPSAKIFETWERSNSNISGLAAALAYANDLEVENIWPRIQELASHLRSGLEQIDGVRCHDYLSLATDGQVESVHHDLSGIVSFSKDGISAEATKMALIAKEINTSFSLDWMSLVDMQHRGLSESNRASVHYYNTHEEVDKLIAAVAEL